MSDAVLMFGDTARSMDMFAALPLPVLDPFLYAEVDGRRIAVVGFLEHDHIRSVDPDIELLDTLGYGRNELMEQGADWIEAQLETSRRAIRELGVTRAIVGWDFPLALSELLRADGIELVEDHRAFERRRRVKSGLQLDGIRRAQHAADTAMAQAARLVRECAGDLTAEQVREAMIRVCDERDCDLTEEAIVAVNGQAASGHDSGSGPIRAGDVVLVDIWPRDRASLCFADMTRTFVAGGGEASEEIATYWRLTKQALDATLAAVRPGISGRELYDISAQVYEDAGLPTLRCVGTERPDVGYLHGLGHGVGLDVHEAPGLGLAGEELVAGDVITLEPGCYRTGVGGVRLEDLVLVTDDGAENLTDFPYGLAP